MRRLPVLIPFLFFSLLAFPQKADFKAAEKFRGDNLTPRDGDLSVNPIGSKNRIFLVFL
jgi:hypothetical protein